jgi:division protein CdvB (Snf7/Vps24/ESCRT-III family)
LADNNFSGKWQADRSKEPFSSRVKSTVNPPTDLRKKLNETDRSLSSQIVKLDKSIAKMEEKEKKLFTRTSSAMQKHDTVSANAYASELTELRKAIKLVNGAKLSLESVQGRLKTITDIGDLATVLAPVGQVVRTVRRTLVAVMPSANETMGEINSGLEGLMQDIGSISGISGFSFDTTSEEAEKILAEASVVAETKMASTLPDLPDVSSSDQSTTDTSI